MAWQEFLRGKRKRQDVAEFSLHLLDNIFALHEELVSKTYRHGGYQAFKINDPKPRDIHKASVRDRLIHHAIYRAIYPYFDRKFIFDSYSCRLGKGTHRAINRFREYGRIVSRNHTRTAWVLKGDIRKFFASIDHEILKNILAKYIGDEDVLWLLGEVVGSFKKVPPLSEAIEKAPLRKGENSRQRIGGCINVASSCKDKFYRSWNTPHPSVFLGKTDAPHGRGGVFIAPLIKGVGGFVGLPLGNLTSQLFVNIYMNELDQFIKRKLKIKYYIRYADDFVIFHEDRNYLEKLIPQIAEFLETELKLSLHPDKVFVKTLASGVDFLGWTHFPHQRILRTATKWRMFRRLEREFKPAMMASYLGLLSHGNTHKILVKIRSSRRL